MHEKIIPHFNLVKFIIGPWGDLDLIKTFALILLMAILVTLSCGLVGNYLVLRKLSLIGDAMSHSILPGIAIAFLISQSRSPIFMFAGAVISGLFTTIIIEFIHSKSKIKQDAAIGITFSTLFALGVILITLFGDNIDLDADCVLYGDLGSVPLKNTLTFLGIKGIPYPIFFMTCIFILALLLIIFFYKELLISAFDETLANIISINPKIIHYGFMIVLSLIVVNAFEAVGAILVIAMLILPASTSYILTNNLKKMLILTSLICIMSSVIGIHLSIWLNCSIAAAIVLASKIIFLLAWVWVIIKNKFFTKLNTVGLYATD